MIKGLSQSQIERIKSATEELLETVGFKVQHDEVLRKCKSAGARVDDTTGAVRLPRTLLRELLAKVPSTYTVSNILGRQNTVGGNNQYLRALEEHLLNHTKHYHVYVASWESPHPCQTPSVIFSAKSLNNRPRNLYTIMILS